jgi:hypothetical protein
MLRNVPSTTYSLLLLAQAENDETQIMMGFRVQDTRWPADEAHSPTHALHLLLAECGVPSTLDGATAMLHNEATVADFMLQVQNRPERGFMHAAVVPRADGRFEVWCAFAIDQDRYERAMRSP